METVRLGLIDYVILLVYTVFVLGIGFALKRFMKTSTDFFLSGRSIPAWIAALALVSAAHTALTGATGHWLASLHTYGSDMAQNFWMAIYSWSTCFVLTLVISLLTTRKKTDDELRGLVYSLTGRFAGDDHLAWYAKPAALAVVMIVITFGLNVIFW